MEVPVGWKVFNGDLRVIIWLVLLLTFALWLVKIYMNKRNFFKMASRIPSPKGMPFYGVTLDWLGKSIDENFYGILELYRRSPEIFKTWVGPMLMVGVSKPEHMEIAFTHPNSQNKSAIVDFTKCYMGDGLFSAPADIWKRHRKLLNPVFNQKALNFFIPIFSEKCEILVGILEKEAGSGDLDIFEKISGCTLDTICETAMGLRVDAQTTSSRYAELLNKSMEIITFRIFNVFYHPQIIFDRTPLGKRLKEMISELNVFSKTIIAKRKADFESMTRGEYIEEKGDNRIKTFLDLLLEISHSGNKFTDQEIQDEVNTFISAGSDTTSATLSFCSMMLGMFPEYQQKMYEESVEVLGQDRYPTKEDLPKLQFMEMFIKETLRLFPIAPLLVRLVSDEIEIDNLILPKETIILLGIMHLHRNPKYWENPLKFDPYRFSPEEWSKKHPFSYLPFTGGPRICFGYRYAFMIMKVILSKLVRKFEFKTGYKCVEEVQLTLKMMMRPSDGFKVSLKLRE